MTSDTPGQLDVDWDKPARSERFLVYIQVVGADAEPRYAVTVKDTNVTLTGLPPGAEVKVFITAANAAGEAAPSDEETAKVLALPKAA